MRIAPHPGLCRSRTPSNPTPTATTAPTVHADARAVSPAPLALYASHASTAARMKHENESLASHCRMVIARCVPRETR